MSDKAKTFFTPAQRDQMNRQGNSSKEEREKNATERKDKANTAIRTAAGNDSRERRDKDKTEIIDLYGNSKGGKK
ncbi:hypothetical protein N7448_011415 [Penicillium atrosanguineum]|uniref:Uncharacterized protein n=1 Tax=Penicillium atrosanguineum TaxID=1132637 RepID=A0A9W9U5C4_9EURO|nr:hypothetical protein N7448_011415 [Penicillium atrosanguineum]KAJ5318733.1 hypothetical protein N7476_005153 [Penicillium atrosanguineum]